MRRHGCPPRSFPPPAPPGWDGEESRRRDELLFIICPLFVPHCFSFNLFHFCITFIVLSTAFLFRMAAVNQVSGAPFYYNLSSKSITSDISDEEVYHILHRLLAFDPPTLYRSPTRVYQHRRLYRFIDSFLKKKKNSYAHHIPFALIG